MNYQETIYDKVRVMLPSPHQLQLVDENAFMFRKERPYHWLQRAALWVLRKLCCERVFDTYTVQYTEVDCAALWQAVERQVFAIRNVWNMERLTIVVGGAENYLRFVSEVYDQAPFMMEMQREIGRNTSYGPQYKFLGADVVFLPYWDGLVVLPGRYEGR
jgi:hypothetical protein